MLITLGGLAGLLAVWLVFPESSDLMLAGAAGMTINAFGYWQYNRK